MEQILEQSYPIPTKPTWKVVDSTKLNVFMQCPRRYMWEYIFGWQPEATNVHLVFGECWHLAMKRLLESLRDHGEYTKEALDEAKILFVDRYREEFPAELDHQHHPKNPGSAFVALDAYVERYKHEDKFKVLYTEVAGTVPITPDFSKQVTFKMDAVCESEDGWIFLLEHKTASRMSRQWTDQWALSVQVGAYVYAATLLFPDKNVWGAHVNGAFFYKSSAPDFVRAPVRKDSGALSVWLHTVNEWMDNLALEHEAFSQCSLDDDILFAFPMQPNHCTSYFGCPYRDFCVSWPNPLKELDRGIQPGFVERHWDPREEHDGVEKKLELEYS